MSRKNELIYCNCCGKVICAVELEQKTSYLAIRKAWGYFSNGKDGKIHSVDICESCCEKIAETFVLPPEDGQLTEYL